MGFGSHATRVSAPKRDWTIAPLRPPPTSPRIQRPAAKCPAVCFVVTKLPTLGPNTRRNLAGFPIASRVRRKRQRLRSNRLIASAAARFHISRYSSAASLPIIPSVYLPRSCRHGPSPPAVRCCAIVGYTEVGPQSSRCSSADRNFWFDLGGEGLRYYLPVSHHKRVGSEFVRIVCCFRSPDNIGVITLDGSLLHRKRGARFRKLRNEGLKERLDRLRAS